MTPPSEQKPPTVEDLFVDIGLSADEAKEHIEIGDMVTLYRELEWSGHNIMSKALDDRVGIFVMLEALRALDGPTEAEIFAVATVQEEVGTRGAGTAAFAIEPDVALALDISPAGDYAGAPEETAGLWLGKGVGIKAMDMSTISSYPLNLHLKQLARDNGIPFQMEILVRGGTDAGAMQASPFRRPGQHPLNPRPLRPHRQRNLLPDRPPGRHRPPEILPGARPRGRLSGAGLARATTRHALLGYWHPA